MNRQTVRWAAATAMFFLLAGCVEEISATPSEATVVKQTLDAMLTQVILQAQLTDTARPTSTHSPIPKPTDTPTEIATVQFISETPDPDRPAFEGPTPTIDPDSLLTRTITAKCNAAFFVGDIPPIFDGSEVHAGMPFTKTWDVRNIGVCTWYPGYRLVFQYGQHMNGPHYIEFPQVVPPNGHIFLSVPLTAPPSEGIKEGQWYLMDPDGNRFGVEEDGVERPLVVRIKVIP